MDTKLFPMMAVVVVVVAVGAMADYIRPPPRETLHFPLSSKRSSYPQQVSFILV